MPDNFIWKGNTLGLRILLFDMIGLNKMVINQLEKLFVTSDAATIIKELEVTILQNQPVSEWLYITCQGLYLIYLVANCFQVQHPAAKMLILASQMQEQEVIVKT